MSDNNTLIEVIKISVPAIVAFLVGLSPSLIKRKKDEADSILQYHQQILNQYNTIVERVDKLELDVHNKSLEILELKEKNNRLEDRISQEFNYLSVLYSYYENIPRPAWLKGTDGVMYFINDAYEDEFGVSKFAYEGQLDSNIWGDTLAEEFSKTDKEVVESVKGTVFVESLPIHPNSSIKQEYEVMKFPVIYNKQLIGIGGIVCKKLGKGD